MKKLSGSLLCLAFLSSLVMISCKSSDDKPASNNLRFLPEEGKRYEFDIDWDLTQTIMGQKNNFTVGGRFSFSPVKADTSESELQAAYEAFRMSMQAGAMKMAIDTDKPDTDVDKATMQTDPEGFMTRAFLGIRGKTFNIRVNKHGEVVSIQGFNRILRGVLDTLAGNDEDRMTAELSLNDQFSDAAVKEQFVQLFSVLPPTAIKPGSTWRTLSQRGATTVPLNYENIYTLQKENDERLTIDVKSTITGNDNMEANGTETGTLIVERKTGLVLEGTLRQKATVKTEAGEVVIEGKGTIRRR